MWQWKRKSESYSGGATAIVYLVTQCDGSCHSEGLKRRIVSWLTYLAVKMSGMRNTGLFWGSCREWHTVVLVKRLRRRLTRRRWKLGPTLPRPRSCPSLAIIKYPSAFKTVQKEVGEGAERLDPRRRRISSIFHTWTPVW